MKRRAALRTIPALIDLDRVRTYPLAGRSSKVAATALGRVPSPSMSVGRFLRALPDILGARDLRAVAQAVASRHRDGRLVVLGMGAHPIKVGLSPLIIDLMQRGILSAVAMNGACIIHDFELAYHAATSEDVAAALSTGAFGMAEETGRFLNDAITRRGEAGLGAAVGQAILDAKLPHRRLSILAAGVRLGVPVTVHVAIGTDIIHLHPSADGAAIGAASLADFHRLAGIVQRLHRGVFVNLGSAVIIPEVFLKALNLARNVGSRVGELVTLDMDFMRHYRPAVNVVQRPTQGDGMGYQLTGHHEIMFPLLCVAVLDALRARPGRARSTRARAIRLGRYDNPYACVSFAALDPAVRREPVALQAADGGISTGILYTHGRPRTAVCFMHPQADMSRHYATPALAGAGYAVFGQNSRWLNNDALCVHEALLLDVAAGVRFLRQRGFERIVLIGNSGGGSLYAFYIAQSATAPPARLRETPAGDGLDLNAVELPPVEGFVMLAAHLGEGRVLMQMIDPSVIDESDPLSCDTALDPFNPANGYRHPPASSRYSPDFVQRYRQAQRDRVARLDAIARRHLAARAEARDRLRAGDFGARPWGEQARALRASVVHPHMIVFRTEADLRAFDLSLDPSERDTGSLFSYRPDLTNYMEFGFARVTTPRAWLSTWSGLASNAAVEVNGPRVTVPSLVLSYTGDNAIFPGDAQAAYAAHGARDKQISSAPGDHYGFAVGTQERTAAPIALAKVVEWLRERFPA